MSGGSKKGQKMMFQIKEKQKRDSIVDGFDIIFNQNHDVILPTEQKQT